MSPSHCRFRTSLRPLNLTIHISIRIILFSIFKHSKRIFWSWEYRTRKKLYIVVAERNLALIVVASITDLQILLKTKLCLLILTSGILIVIVMQSDSRTSRCFYKVRSVVSYWTWGFKAWRALNYCWRLKDGLICCIRKSSLNRKCRMLLLRNVPPIGNILLMVNKAGVISFNYNYRNSLIRLFVLFLLLCDFKQHLLVPL